MAEQQTDHGVLDLSQRGHTVQDLMRDHGVVRDRGAQRDLAAGGLRDQVVAAHQAAEDAILWKAKPHLEDKERLQHLLKTDQRKQYSDNGGHISKISGNKTIRKLKDSDKSMLPKKSSVDGQAIKPRKLNMRGRKHPKPLDQHF